MLVYPFVGLMYMDFSLIVGLNSFIRHAIGLITQPYETTRDIVDHGHAAELVYVAAVLAAYFTVTSVVRVAAFRPFLLTREFILLAGFTGVTYLIAVALFWTAGKIVGAQGKLRGLAIAWGYSLISTVVWFLATSLLYVILPPPRTTSLQGILFSMVFLVFSATLFFWKVTIGYLSLRFGLRLDLGKILIVAAIAIPILGAYSYGLYRLGIFRVPFI